MVAFILGIALVKEYHGELNKGDNISQLSLQRHRISVVGAK